MIRLNTTTDSLNLPQDQNPNQLVKPSTRHVCCITVETKRCANKIYLNASSIAILFIYCFFTKQSIFLVSIVAILWANTSNRELWAFSKWEVNTLRSSGLWIPVQSVRKCETQTITVYHSFNKSRQLLCLGVNLVEKTRALTIWRFGQKDHSCRNYVKWQSSG